ncbi:uncharacterized protein DNG_09511 [Cephalotrichum gorgonifer]|uniref:Uncharacterized protein n=1 Tax=Cephalotrichum gorgonifer TaxID=2041049 RepID=A0AAE8N604_9PEZI|nr:uncharacterized protein DNG_09511 [Cephalotrichum gorgonifer]
MEFAIDELSDGARNVVMSESAYKELSPPERLAVWKNSDAISAEKIIQHMGEFGKGGWLSRIVDPQRFSEPLRLEPDSDSENDDSDWEEWSKDELLFPPLAKLRTKLRVPRRRPPNSASTLSFTDGFLQKPPGFNRTLNSQGLKDFRDS